MPSQQAETPQKNPRGSRRPRKSANSTPSHNSYIPNDAEPSVDLGRRRESGQSTRILRRGDHEIAPDISVVGNLELPNPTTPPRPRSMYDDFSNGQYEGNQSAPDTNQRRRKGRKSQGGITRASGVRRPDPNEASIQSSPQKPFTPSRPNETPVKAYAGPGFNASPAASALPMPKFISRSVPNVDKTSNLKTMMEQETIDTTSESDGSPFLKNSQLTKDGRAREDSPLDIFFQADRDAKAKAQVRSPAVSNGLRSDSQNELGHHLRQAIDSSLGGMFPLEMDGAASESSDTNSDEPNIPAPKAMTEADDKDEQLRATTLAFKKLFYSPAQPPASSSPRSGTASQNIGPPSPNTTPRRGSPGLVPDSTSRDQQRHAALLALAQKQVSGIGTNNGSAAQRPPSSKLRKELSVPSSPGVQPLELPATPTHSHVQNTSTPTNCRAQQQHNGYVSPYSPLSSAFTPPAKPPGEFRNTSSKDARSIEEDLRRILKLDVLGGDNITGVRS